MSAETTKRWISADELLLDSFRLARLVIDSGYRPTLLIGLWRGGAAVAVAVHESLAWHGLACAHMPLLTRLYTGIDMRAGAVQIEGLGDLAPKLAQPARILVVDDVFDTGVTMQGVLAAILALPGAEREIRSATVWHKPGRNRTTLQPDYRLRTTEDWLVFPHELQGIDAEELRRGRGEAFLAALGGADASP
ncbi:MAG: phosphoribosyltransferase [Gammaproteobacteria bacterium]